MIVGSECGYFDRMRGVIQDLADAAVTWKFLGAATSDDRVTLSFEERRGVTRWIELQMSPEPQLMAVRGRCQADDGSDRWEEEIRLSDWQERAGAILPWRMVYRTSSWGTGDGAQSDDAALAHTASVSVLQRISLEPLEASLQSEFEEILEAGPGTKIEDRRHGITYMLGSSEMSGACGALTGSEIPDVLSDPTGWIRAARPQSSDGPPWWLDFIHP
jgi:hypothetical protein